MQLILYVLIAISSVLPLVYRHSRAVRVCSVIVLCLIATLHAGFLVGLPMLVMDGYSPLNTPNTTELPDAYMSAVKESQRLSNLQIGPFVSLVIAFALLALIPVKAEDVSTSAEK